MANNESDVLHLKSFSELIGKIFLIPYLQRGYKWTALNVEEPVSYTHLTLPTNSRV